MTTIFATDEPPPRERKMYTDNELQQAVLAALKQDPELDHSAIRVWSSEGIVILSGRVASFAERWIAERDAGRVPGVRALSMEVEVVLPDANRRRDVDLAHSAANMLEWTRLLPANAVKVSVEDGWLTLSGELDWQYQRQAANSSVRNLIGITGISDLIAVRSRASSVAIKSQANARKAATRNSVRSLQAK